MSIRTLQTISFECDRCQFNHTLHDVDVAAGVVRVRAIGWKIAERIEPFVGGPPDLGYTTYGETLCPRCNV